MTETIPASAAPKPGVAAPLQAGPLADGPDRSNPKVRQVLEAARTLFLEQPYDAVSTDAVAKLAKVSKATLYVYFPSKDVLFATLVHDHCSRIGHDIWSCAVSTDDVEVVLRKIAQSFLALFASPEALALHRTIIGQVTRFPELGRVFYEAGPRMLLGHIAAFLQAATGRGQLMVDDADLAAVQFLQLVSADMPLRGLLALPSLSQPHRDRATESGIAMFLSAYRAGPQVHRLDTS